MCTSQASGACAPSLPVSGSCLGQRALLPLLLPLLSLILFCLCYRSSFLLPWTFPPVLCCQNDVSMTCTSYLVSLQLQLSVSVSSLHKIRAPFPTLWVFTNQLPDCFSRLASTSAVDCALAGTSVLCKDSGWSFCLCSAWLILSNPSHPSSKIKAPQLSPLWWIFLDFP